MRCEKHGVELDTLTFSLAALGEAVLRKGLSTADVRASYTTWLERIAAGCVSNREQVCLVHAGTDGGTLHLRGRAKPWEFVILVEHAEFRALVALGFEQCTQSLDAVWLVSFSGDAMDAARWAADLRRQVNRPAAAEPASVDPVTATRGQVASKYLN